MIVGFVHLLADLGSGRAVPVGAKFGAKKTGRPDDFSTETGSGGVGGTLGLPPSAITLPEGELTRSSLAGGQALDPHSHQPNPLTGAQHLKQRPGGLEDLAADVRRHRQGP